MVALLHFMLVCCVGLLMARRKRPRTRPFRFLPPSPQQLRLMSWWVPGNPKADCVGVIAEGSIRSGKTVCEIDGFITQTLEQFSYEDFIIAGRTIGSLKRNVLKPLFQILEAKGIDYYHHRSENWIQIGTNTYYLFGGANEASKDDLAGLTAAGALIEEVTRLHESFVKECFNRCSVDGAKLWFNLNPGPPKHWFKVEFIDKAEEKGLYHLHFVLDDNPALSEARKAFYRTMFPKGSVWYKRYILGLWVMAEGVIFDMFREEGEASHVVDTDGVLRKAGRTGFTRYIVACDYGTAASAMTFGLYGLYERRKDGGGTETCAHLVKEYHYSGKESGRSKTDGEYADDYKEWIGDVRPSHVYVDPSAASFIAELRTRRVPVREAENAVEDGNRYVAEMLSAGRFTVDPSCEHTISEFYAYVWDPKWQEKGEDRPLKENDHHMDRNRYALYTHLGVPQPHYGGSNVST